LKTNFDIENKIAIVVACYHALVRLCLTSNASLRMHETRYWQLFSHPYSRYDHVVNSYCNLKKKSAFFIVTILLLLILCVCYW